MNVVVFVRFSPSILVVCDRSHFILTETDDDLVDDVIRSREDDPETGKLPSLPTRRRRYHTAERRARRIAEHNLQLTARYVKSIMRSLNRQSDVLAMALPRNILEDVWMNKATVFSTLFEETNEQILSREVSCYFYFRLVLIYSYMSILWQV